jgi:hypothetical protein
MTYQKTSILKTERHPEEETLVFLLTPLTRGIWLITERRTLGYSPIDFSIKFND